MNKKFSGPMKKGDPPRNPNVYDSEYMRELAKRPRTAKGRNIARAEQGLVTPAELLEEEGFDEPEKAPAELRLLAEKAVGGNTADMQLFLRQSQKLRPSPKGQEMHEPDGRCPHCDEDMGSGPIEFVLGETSLEGLKMARTLALEKAIHKLDPDNVLLTDYLA